MSNITQMDRDCYHIQLTGTNIQWPTTTGTLSSDGIVYQNVATMRSAATTDASATGQNVGLMIQQPVGTRVPYRVKGWYTGSSIAYLTVGRATTTTGTNDTVASGQFLTAVSSGWVGTYDEVILLDEISPAEPLYFAWFTNGQSQYVTCGLSVQRLNTAGPRYDAAIK